MKKRIISFALALTLLVSALPLTVWAASDYNAVKLLDTSGDFLGGYYVRYEINGVEYRSDQASADMNKLAWKGMSDKDRKATLYVYAFAPDARQQQFGTDGSKEMTDYINEKQGWTALWAAYADRVEQQQCGPLMEFYSDENFATTVQTLKDNAKGDYDSWYNRMTWYSEYQEARDVMERLGCIDVLMNLGKQAYDGIVTSYMRAREASVKAISKELISIIVDKALTPNITVAPTAATTSVYTGVVDLLFAVTGTSDQITQQVVGKTQDCMGAVDVINAMRELAQKNYTLATFCYNRAKALSDDIPNQAKAAYEICQKKRENNELQAAFDAEEERRAQEEQERHEAEYAEALETLYNSMTSGAPKWNPPKGSTWSELATYWSTYKSAVDSFVAAKKPAYASSYNSLAGAYDSWFKKYREAADDLIDNYDLYRMRNIERELYPDRPESELSGITFNWPYCRDYQPTEPGWVYYSYVDFTDDELADYDAAVDDYKSDLRNAKVDAHNFMDSAVDLYEDAIAEYHDLVARQNALVSSNRVTYVMNYDNAGDPLSYDSLYLRDGVFDAFHTAWDSDSEEADNSKKLLDYLQRLSDLIGESDVDGVDVTIRRIDDMTAEMKRMRRERLQRVSEQIDESNRFASNYHLAAAWGAQMRDKRDALLESLPSYVSEIKGYLVDSWTNALGTFYGVSPAARITDPASAGPELAELLASASDPLKKAREEGEALSAKWDEYNRLTKCMDNAVLAMEYYMDAANVHSYDIAKYTNGYGLQPLVEMDYWADRDYIYAPMDQQQTHDLAAMQLLARDLSGWGADHAAISLKLAELRSRKSALIRQLQTADEWEQSGIINDLRHDIQQLYAYYTRDSFHGYACYAGNMADKKMSNDDYRACREFIDWLEANYTSYILPDGIHKKGVHLLADDPDLLLAGVGDRGQLLAEVTPADATEKGVVWESLTPDVLEVDENGVVTAVAEGEGQIRARALDAPAEPVYDGDDIVDYTYEDEYYVTFDVRVDEAAYGEAEGSEDYLWRNFGTSSDPQFVRVTEAEGKTAVTAAFRAEIDDRLLCMALYDSEGRMIAFDTVHNGGFEQVIQAETETKPASVRLFLLNPDMTPASVPPVDQPIE